MKKMEGQYFENGQWSVTPVMESPYNTKTRKISGIYVIEIACAKSVYVGLSTNMVSRWSQHKHALRKRTCECRGLQELWDRDFTSFRFKLVEETSEDLKRKENMYAQQLVQDGWSLLNDYFMIEPSSLMMEKDHARIVVKMLRLVTKGKFNISELDRHLDTL